MLHPLVTPIRATGLVFAAALAISANATATPVGSSYTLSLQSFPVDLADSAPLTFNATGDLSLELAASDAISVNEQFIAGGGASGGDLLTFRFVFNQAPANVGTPFGFSINGLGWSEGGDRQLLNSSLAIDFGVSQLLATDVTALTTASNSGGLGVRLSAPTSWAGVFSLSNPPADTRPSQIITTFSFEVAQVPEPSTILLAGSALLLALRLRRAAEPDTSTK
jgi:hypothetical protein